MIDPEARSAELDVVFDSGPAFHFGAFEVTGLSRYTKELVRNFSTISPGELYSRSLLDDYIRRLLASGYFASVQASIDTSIEQADNATVTLAVIEAPTKRVELGAGFSTDTRYRVSANYSDMDIDGHALQFYADLRLESTTQSGHLRLVQPPTSKGWLDSYSLGLERTDIENLQTRTVSAVVRRQYIDERNTPAFSAGYYWDQQTPDGGSLDQSHALYRRRRVHLAKGG